MSLGDMRNSSKGWLHDGSLRIEAKLLSAVDDMAGTDVLLGSNPQKEMSKDFGALFASGENADVVLKLKDERIHARALILTARSSVLAAMLSSPMREGKEREIDLSDLDASAVKAMIGFLYSGEVDSEVLQADDSALGLLEAAHRYNAPSLIDLCVRALVGRFDVATVAE